ncbi:hypothetical protein GGR56DRAFT_148356 [Xylariaceae sp. FL0804]|nr:hypothetical protein GGR56DRAFT_148356 [Xylariaceae sp. FL0804]
MASPSSRDDMPSTPASTCDSEETYSLPKQHSPSKSRAAVLTKRLPSLFLPSPPLPPSEVSSEDAVLSIEEDADKSIETTEATEAIETAETDTIETGTIETETIESDTIETETIKRVLDTVRSRHAGRPVQDYPTFYLDAPSYQLLLERLKHHDLLDFFWSLRKRWNAETGKLVFVFMADAIHEVFKSEFDFELRTELKRVVRDFPSLQPLGRQLVAGGHTNISSGRHWTRSPDGQLRMTKKKFPPFIYEIAHSQRAQDLDEAVDEYFDTLRGSIGAFLAFKFDYNNDLIGTPDFRYTGWVTLWTAKVEGDTQHLSPVMDKVIFRQQGRTLPGHLVLPFHFFIPPGDHHLIPADVRDVRDTARSTGGTAGCDIVIDFAKLGEWVETAEECQRSQKAATPEPEVQVKTAIKRKVTWDADGLNQVKTKQYRAKRQRTEAASTTRVTRSASRSERPTPRRSQRSRSRDSQI